MFSEAQRMIHFFRRIGEHSCSSQVWLSGCSAMREESVRLGKSSFKCTRTELNEPGACGSIAQMCWKFTVGMRKSQPVPSEADFVHCNLWIRWMDCLWMPTLTSTG